MNVFSNLVNDFLPYGLHIPEKHLKPTIRRKLVHLGCLASSFVFFHFLLNEKLNHTTRELKTPKINVKIKR